MRTTLLMLASVLLAVPAMRTPEVIDGHAVPVEIICTEDSGPCWTGSLNDSRFHRRWMGVR